MSELWVKEWCPICKTANWLCIGDPVDLSGEDIEGIECFKCGHKWVNTEDLDCLNDPDNPDYTVGRQTPT